MKLIYKIGTKADEKPKINLSVNGQYLGTIWGEVEEASENDFAVEHGIINISGKDGKRISTLWDAQKA
ncbi:hypothetical protein LCGC14_0543750 [marine sediment metagenome]|uniref:Uncharacterized protein n=1 Tax=marine sediment metagenome TaxID=412755 RepID=A0A0F9UDI5_9ZZZZ